MIVVLQRVTRAAVSVGGETVGVIDRGLCLLVCGVVGDAEADADWLAEKVAGLRVFEDTDGRTNLALHDVGGAVLVVPQFTLAADVRKGRRPSFVAAAAPEHGRALTERFAAGLRRAGLLVEEGVFGADMSVELANDGPFTLIIDSSVRPG